MNTNKQTNRLIHETSPYLQQHAYNPVDWFPWGDEAFAKAKAEDKPVFLSIGYSACHWCHVMERESFEDKETARLLNENFVSIKLDREERPDIDHIYMDACVSLNGQGGWPLSCFLTPEKKPFYCGTYFPKDDYYHVPSFKNILLSIIKLWHGERQKLYSASDEIMRHVSKKKTLAQEQIQDAPQAAFKQLKKSYDSTYGGFGSAPKFPSAHNLLFLMRYGLLNKDKNAFKIAKNTLACMARGGIFDHIGGGFCRYSTDRYWLVPHFEKMMYDNAMLIMAYAEAGALIDKSYFLTVNRITDYCFAVMADENGGFYTAQDADSEGVEGKYYVFTPKEMEDALGRHDAERFCKLFDITEKGNFEGKNIPNHIKKDLTDEEKVFADECFPRIYEYRKHRVSPFKDDKILTMVNALMIAALSIAGYLMNEDNCIAAAKRCAVFIQKTMIQDGRLMASFRSGLSAHPATLEDYAYLAWGFLELYQATFEPKWLIESAQLMDQTIALFGEEGEAFYMSGKDVADVPVRTKSNHDSALPSGNSIAAMVLLRLSNILENDLYRKKAEDVLTALSGEVNAYPFGFTALMWAQRC